MNLGVQKFVKKAILEAKNAILEAKKAILEAPSQKFHLVHRLFFDTGSHRGALGKAKSTTSTAGSIDGLTRQAPAFGRMRRIFKVLGGFLG